MRDNQLIVDLYDIGAIKFGDFTLKSGIQSPIYIDLRLIVSHPHILKKVADAIGEKLSGKKFDIICGVPYTALPIATCLSIEYSTPMVMRRKEEKTYGTKKVIEGDFKAGQRCLIIEDLITSGSSVFETVEPLENVGLIVENIVVFLDREQGGHTHILSKGYQCDAVYKISDILHILEEYKRISTAKKGETEQFIAANQV